jgi:peptidyl-prolyl cis-trans isomerase SurA
MNIAEKRGARIVDHPIHLKRILNAPTVIAVCVWLACLIVALPAGEPRAERELVDRVVAIVEDEAIFQKDIEQAVKQFLLEQGRTSLPDSARMMLESQVLASMIGDKLMVAQAKELGIEVPFEEVEEIVERTIKEKQDQIGGEEAFKRQLELENLTVEELKRLYRTQIKTRMLTERVGQSEIDRTKLAVTDEELMDSFEQNKAQLPARPEVVHLQTIFISFESSEDAKQVARSKAEAIYQRIQSGEDFAELAKQNSEDPSANTGGDLGFLKLEDLREQAFAQAAAQLRPGEVGRPILTSLGFHIIKVEEINSDSGEVRLRHILIRVKAGEGDVKSIFDTANTIRDRILAGEPFDSLAVRYSDDPATASAGGDLGWLKLQDLPEFFQEVLQGMNPGDISQVLRETSGFRIVKLLERQAGRSYTFEEVRNELRRTLEQEKLAIAYEEYLQTLRAKFYVKMVGSN